MMFGLEVLPEVGLLSDVELLSEEMLGLQLYNGFC